MKNLKSKVIIFLSLCLFGCQTNKKFEIVTHSDGDNYNDQQIVTVATDRIKHECYFMNAEAENNWRHQYFMYILNDKNEVIPVMYPTNQGDVECLSHLKEVERIIQRNPSVKMCLRGQMQKNSEKTVLHDFDRLGKHREVYGALDFDSICNDKKCYSINEIWMNTCPGFKKNERSEK